MCIGEVEGVDQLHRLADGACLAVEVEIEVELIVVGFNLEGEEPTKEKVRLIEPYANRGYFVCFTHDWFVYSG